MGAHERDRRGEAGGAVSAPVLAWERGVRSATASATLVEMPEQTLVRAQIVAHGGAWRVRVWCSGAMVRLGHLSPDLPSAPTVPDAVLLAAEAWLREHVRGIAWPDEPEPEATVTAGEDYRCDGRRSPWPDVFLGRPTCQMAATTSDPTAELRALLINGHCPVCEREIGIYPPGLALGSHATGCALDAAIVADPTAMNAKRVDILQTMATAPAAIADDLAEAVYAIDLELMRCMSLLQETRARCEEESR